MKNKLINNFTSRPFLVLIIAVVAFFTTDKFPWQALITTFGIYCGYNLGNKFIAEHREPNIIDDVIDKKEHYKNMED